MPQVYPVRIQHTIAAPVSKVWPILSDHENMRDWTPTVKKTEILKAGTPKNGVGTYRKIYFKLFFLPKIHEEIVVFEPEVQFHYTLLKGLPGLHSHLGKVILDKVDENSCQLRWEIDFEFKPNHPINLVRGLFLSQLAKGLDDGIIELKKLVE